MIVEITSEAILPLTKYLLSYATSPVKVEKAYQTYLRSSDWHLFGLVEENLVIGCIGVETGPVFCEIKHLAVSPEERGIGRGTEMIQYILKTNPGKSIVAETDHEAVDFYRKSGFMVTSLGEKYPGVERFFCDYAVK